MRYYVYKVWGKVVFIIDWLHILFQFFVQEIFFKTMYQ